MYLCLKSKYNRIMGLYEGIKDVAKVIQKADNIDLYRQLLDLSAQALDLQLEVAALKTENAELKKGKAIESQIERYKGQKYITLTNDSQKIKYCSFCWDSDRKLIQVTGSGIDTHCKICSIKYNKGK